MLRPLNRRRQSLLILSFKKDCTLGCLFICVELVLVAIWVTIILLSCRGQRGGRGEFAKGCLEDGRKERDHS